MYRQGLIVPKVLSRLHQRKIGFFLLVSLYALFCSDSESPIPKPGEAGVKKPVPTKLRFTADSPLFNQSFGDFNSVIGKERDFLFPRVSNVYNQVAKKPSSLKPADGPRMPTISAFEFMANAGCFDLTKMLMHAAKPGGRTYYAFSSLTPPDQLLAGM